MSTPVHCWTSACPRDIVHYPDSSTYIVVVVVVVVVVTTVVVVVINQTLTSM